VPHTKTLQFEPLELRQFHHGLEARLEARVTGSVPAFRHPCNYNLNGMDSSDAHPESRGRNVADLPTPDGQNGASLPPDPHVDSSHNRDTATRLLAGAAVGAFCGLLFCQLTLADSYAWLIVTVSAVLGAVMGPGRFSRIVWGAGALAAAGILVIALTPLVPWLVRGSSQSDQLEPSDAVISLGAGINTDGTLSHGTQDRALHCLALLHAGYAPRLVLTGGETQGESLIRTQMTELGLNFPVESSGPVDNTHDESVTVARLAQSNGWRRVILVTNAWHMRRAAATFKKAGVTVLCSPCTDTGGDTHHPQTLRDRTRMLGFWLHEHVGYIVYRLRGWI
jgi:uncharacterized SAM-binding protein YcdF (DUF218 family)